MALSKIQAESMNLADTYAFTGTVSGAGAMELISSDNTGATNVANLEITLSQSTDYHHQILVITGFWNQDSVIRDNFIRLYEGGSVVSSSGAYAYQEIARRNGTSTDGAAQDSQTYIRPNWYGAGNATGELTDFYIKIFNAPSSTIITSMTGTMDGKSGTGVVYSSYFNGHRNAAAIAEKFQLSASTGNINYSNYALYGVKL